MRISSLFILFVGAILLVIGAGCGGKPDGNTTPGANNGSTGPAPLVRPTEVPEPYGGMESPFQTAEEKAAAAAAGKDLYLQACSNCHGDSGKGDGSGAVGLNPAPGNLLADDLQAMGDDYLFWRIARGGLAEPFKAARSAMTPFENGYSEEKRWQMVEFVRSLASQ